MRHPIYLGWLLIVFGMPHMTATRLAFAVISSVYLIVAIPFEEPSLIDSFGDEYRRYRQIVRWRLILRLVGRAAAEGSADYRI